MTPPVTDDKSAMDDREEDADGASENIEPWGGVLVVLSENVVVSHASAGVHGPAVLGVVFKSAPMLGTMPLTGTPFNRSGVAKGASEVGEVSWCRGKLCDEWPYG